MRPTKRSPPPVGAGSGIKAAQDVVAAFLLAAASIRKIRTFINNAIEDPGGVLYVPRKQRKGDHARTGLPPGVGPPETAAA